MLTRFQFLHEPAGLLQALRGDGWQLQGEPRRPCLPARILVDPAVVGEFLADAGVGSLDLLASDYRGGSCARRREAPR